MKFVVEEGVFLFLFSYCENFSCRNRKDLIDEGGEMQFFGYPSDAEIEEPVRLSEVSIVASAKTMRELANFLTSCADEMDANKKSYEPDTHFHLRDFLKDEIDVDLIVVPVPEKT